MEIMPTNKRDECKILYGSTTVVKTDKWAGYVAGRGKK
jgi:hypothetical protein